MFAPDRALGLPSVGLGFIPFVIDVSFFFPQVWIPTESFHTDNPSLLPEFFPYWWSAC